MFHSARMMIPALALSAAVALLPATAEAGHCKRDVEAEATVLGVGPGAKHRAVRAAIGAWKREVAAKYGWSYASWSKAQEKRMRCGSRLGGKTECEVEADPCR